MTREQILEIDQYCQEHKVSYKKRLEFYNHRTADLLGDRYAYPWKYDSVSSARDNLSGIMLSLNDTYRYWLYNKPVDMRKSFNGLSSTG